MKNHFMLARALFIFSSSFLLLSCVSVKLPFGPIAKTEKEIYAKPASPFDEFATSSADQAWMSDATGNTISYLSECKKEDKKLEDIALESVKAIDRAKVIKSSTGKIGSKPSSEILATGMIERQKVKFSVAVVRSGECTYSLVYGGLEKDFDKEFKIFEQFKQEFRAP